MTTAENRGTARHLWNTWLAGTNIPRRLLEEYRPGENQRLQQALEMAQQAEAHQPGDPGLRLLTLVGTLGTGKTHLAAGIAGSWVAKGRRVAWFRVSDYLDQLRAAPFEDLADRMMDVGYQHLIVLDDLMAAHFKSEWSHERINQIVDMAWERSKQSMVITTNMRAEDIPPRILDRLTDRNIGRVCVMDGPSFRQTGGIQ